jgi:hypothetical protein
MIITTHLDADGFDPSTDDGGTEGRIDFRPFDTPYPNPALIEWRTPLTAILLILLRYEHKLAADRAALVAMHKEAGLDSIGIQIAAQDKQQGGQMTTLQAVRSYPRQVKTLARKYDTLLQKLNENWDDQDYNRLGKIGDELVMRITWLGGRLG